MVIYSLSNNLKIIKKNFSRLKTFAKSLFFHVYSGFPKSTKEEIIYRFNICTQCEMLDTKNGQCLMCGCNINTKKIFLNKLAWADQKCPLNKWQEIRR